MTRKIFLMIGLLVGLTCSTFSLADVYKTVDKNGRITYTDVPPNDTKAKPIELKSINSIPAPEVSSYIPPVEQRESQNNTNYQLSIIAPENGRTLLADERSITVSVSLNQTLANGDLLAYKLDGAIVTTVRDTNYVISEPPRGEHSLTVDIVNTEGEVVAVSNAVTVVIMRPLVKPPITPAPRK